MNLVKRSSKYACKVEGFFSLVHSATGLLLVGAFLTGLFHEEKKKNPRAEQRSESRSFASEQGQPECEGESRILMAGNLCKPQYI